MVQPHVVVFAGGRGAVRILRELRARGIQTTALVNGYDDGLSTGLIRDLLPEMLGPSDFRKISEALGSRPLDSGRLPLLDATTAVFSTFPQGDPHMLEVYARLRMLAPDPEADMSVGNVRFAYEFLRTGTFQGAVDAYADLCRVGFPLVAVSETPAVLTAWTTTGGLLRSEGAIVTSPWGIVDIGLGPDTPTPAARAVDAVLAATHIVYAPGTFASSIWPSIRVMRRVLQHTTTPHHVLISNAVPDAGMQGWTLGTYARVMRTEGVPLTAILHDSRSRIPETTDGRHAPVLVSRLLDEDLRHHDGPAVVDAILCLN
jgi:2-phospho-L-lactate transferase/gluconeogenesis factor (CofD/UPF0052 family)